MPTLTANLKTQSDLQPTKTGWSAVVQALLGNNRRLIGIRNGVEFLNVASIGALTFSLGDIVKFGELSDVTVRTAADLSTGTCFLRLEGQGESITYTLGLPGSGAEYTLPANPTGSLDEGIAFAVGSGLRAPVMLDSGTGPLSPQYAAGMARKHRLCDWSSGSRVVVGTREFKVREPNIVMEHPWMAREFGDVRRYRTDENEPLIWGTGGDCYEVGGDILIATALINETTNLPLQQVEIRMKPYGRWQNAPFIRNFDITTDTLAPPAHKIEILDENDIIIDVIEMYSTRDASNTPGSGWLVNDPRQSQIWWGATTPLRPLWNCRQSHQWWSHRPKMHSLAQHFCPGVADIALDPRNVTEKSANPEQWLMITTGNGSSISGAGFYRLAPKWSGAYGCGYDTTIVDTYAVQGLYENSVSQADGYGFEPGSKCQHTIYMAPGGPRHDRASWPTVLTSWMTQLNGARLHGNVPWRELWHHWTMGYFNHSKHYFTDVHRGHSVAKELIEDHSAYIRDPYYGSGDHGPTTPDRAVLMFAPGNQTGIEEAPKDKNGNYFNTNMTAQDFMHSQSNGSLGATQTVSPRHVLEARHSFTAHMMSIAGSTSMDVFDVGGLMERWHNWHMLQHHKIWMVANNHPDGFSRAEAEAMWGEHLEKVYDSVWEQYNKQNTILGASLARYGVKLTQVDNPDGTHTLMKVGDIDSKVFYFAQTFLEMKQTGAFAAMCAYSPKSKAALEMLLTCLTTYAVGVFMDANGRTDRVPFYAIPFGGGIANLPPSWNELTPPDGLMDWIRASSGTIGKMPVPGEESPDHINTSHLRAQWVFMIRDYFPEYNFPRVAAACAKVDQWVADVDAGYAAGTNYWFKHRFSNFGIFKKAARIGPPA